MSFLHNAHATKLRRTLTGAIALGVIASAAIAPGVAVAQTATGLVDSMWILKHSNASHRVTTACVRPNGGQILGGFASGDDWINPETGVVGIYSPRSHKVAVC